MLIVICSVFNYHTHWLYSLLSLAMRVRNVHSVSVFIHCWYISSMTLQFIGHLSVSMQSTRPILSQAVGMGTIHFALIFIHLLELYQWVFMGINGFSCNIIRMVTIIHWTISSVLVFLFWCMWVWGLQSIRLCIHPWNRTGLCLVPISCWVNRGSGSGNHPVFPTSPGVKPRVSRLWQECVRSRSCVCV